MWSAKLSAAEIQAAFKRRAIENVKHKLLFAVISTNMNYIKISVIHVY